MNQLTAIPASRRSHPFYMGNKTRKIKPGYAAPSTMRMSRSAPLASARSAAW